MRMHLNEPQNNNVNGAVKYSVEMNVGSLHKQWISERSTIIEHNMNRLGIELGDINIIIHAVNLRGYKYLIQDNTQIVLTEEWCSVPCGYAYQATVSDVKAYIVDIATRFSTPQEAYPPGDQVFLITQGQYYGALAKVVDSESIRSGRIKVQVWECQEPVPTVHAAATPYRNANHAAAACGISTNMLSRITGCVFVIPGVRHDMPTEQIHKINIGLNLKFNKKNQEVSGFTRRCPVTTQWLYSKRCIEVVAAYARSFPHLFDALSRQLNRDIYFEQDLWPNEMQAGHPQAIQAWLKGQPHASAPRRECGSEALEPEEMKVLAMSLDKQLEELRAEEKKVSLHVKWNLLYKPDLHEGNIAPDPKADFKMYDRVVCVAGNMTVPLGAKGTITALFKPGASNTVRLSDKLNVEPSYQVLFDEPFPGGMKEELFEETRFYRMQPWNMLNISFGRRLRSAVTSAPSNEDKFIPAQSRNILRREDGHNSAFASYSPTKDRQTPVVENRNVTPKVLNNAPPDSSTELLKSLLKISQDDEAKLNKTAAAPEPPQSWRARSDSNPQSTPPQLQKPQPTNWRSETSTTVNNNHRTQPSAPNEWMNRNYKGQPPIPPFPTFTTPMQGPGPAQIPFPQFQNPHFQQRNHGNHDGYHRNQNNQPGHQNNQYGNQSNQYGNQHNRSFEQPDLTQNGQQFPKSLPSVSANITLAPPSWNKGPQQANPNPGQQGGRPYTNSGSEKTNNPFVPLQVQASQRRVQNPGSSHSRKDSVPQQMPQPQPLHPSQNYRQQKFQQDNNPLSLPQRKRKPRIAANLPFQTD